MSSSGAEAGVHQAGGGHLLRLRGVSKTFGGIRALQGIAFDLRAGEIHGLAGENGAGKSTFVKLLAGVYRPDAGELWVNGIAHDALTPSMARNSGIAVVHQELNLLPDLSISENVFLGALPSGRMGTISIARAQQRTSEILQRLGSDLDPRRLVGGLTIAQQQFVEIAKALAVDARIIVLDEPSSVLSGEELVVLHAVVRRLREEGRGLIYISHRLDELFALADRITVFKDGRHVSTCLTSELDTNELIRRMVGRPIVELFPRRQAALGPALLEVEGLTVHGRIVDISFTVRQGEIVGVAGLGGSGRTTLARALVGLERVSAGRALLDGAPVPTSPGDCARVGMVLVPEDRKAHGILSGQSVAFNISLASLRRLRNFHLLTQKSERALVTRLIRDFGIRPNTPQTQVQNLSGGNQQKVVLARWLAHSPKVVVLDEPTRGVDVGAKAEIYALIEKLSHTGVSVLMISSELPELLGTCDRVLVLREGRLVADLNRDDASEESLMRAAASESPVASAGRSTELNSENGTCPQ